MARERSPNYPAYGLPSAIQFAKMVWSKEKRTAVDIAVLARALGGEAVSGPVRSKVAAMRHYGLLEPVADKKLKVADRAITLILQRPGQPEYDKAVHEAFLEPALFVELQQDLRDASDEALNFYLVRDRQFSTEGAARVIKSYRESLAFVKPSEMSYDSSIDELSEERKDDSVAQPISPTPAVHSISVKGSDVKNVTFTFTLPSGATAQVIFRDRFPTKRDATKLRQYIELFEADLPSENPVLTFTQVDPSADVEGAQ